MDKKSKIVLAVISLVCVVTIISIVIVACNRKEETSYSGSTPTAVTTQAASLNINFTEEESISPSSTEKETFDKTSDVELKIKQDGEYVISEPKE